MTGVMLGQGVVPVLLFTVHGHVHPIGGSESCGWGPMAPCLARGLHVSLGRGESAPSGSDALMTLRGSGEEEGRSRRLSRPKLLRKAWVGWRLALGFERLTCCQRL
jgi:hypothetical protein